MTSSSAANLINFPRASRQSISKSRFNLCPHPSHRQLICGSTGSGKSVFATRLLWHLNGKRPIAILDSKGEDRLILPHSMFITRAKESVKWDIERYPTLVYRPDGVELIDPDLLDGWIDYLYDLGGILLYIDELSSLQGLHRSRPGITNYLARGRARSRGGVTVRSPLWMATQRPRGIPMLAVSEADRIVMFETNRLPDRKVIADDCHDDFLRTPRRKHGFMLFDRGMSRPIEFGPIKLR